VSGFKKNKNKNNYTVACHVTPRQRLDGVRGVLWRIFILQGCFMENLHIIGLKSNFFFTGSKSELAQITGVKNINPN